MLGIVISEASFMFLLAWGIYHILPLGLELLNFPHLKQKLPKTLNAYYDARKYKQTQARWQRYSIFRMIKISCQFIIGLLLIYFTFFTLLDKHLSEWLSNDYLLIIVFAMAVILIIHLVELPFDYVEFWVLPKKFSSANHSQPFHKHLLHKVANALLVGTLVGGIICLLAFWKQYTQDMWFAFWTCLCLFAIWFLFNRAIASLMRKVNHNSSVTGINASQFKVWEIWQKSRSIWEVIPSEGLLAKNIQSACKNFNFPTQNIFAYPYEGNNKAYGHAFAYKQQVFLSETLINELKIGEAEAVFYHELWHTQNTNWLKSILKPFIYLFVFMLFGISVFYDLPLIGLFSGSEVGIHLQVLSFTIVLLPFKYFWLALWNGYSRHQERQADMFALNLTDEQDVKRALGTLSGWDLEVPEPNILYQWFFYSHPPISERIGITEATTVNPIGVEELTHKIETLRNSLNYSGSNLTPPQEKEAKKQELLQRKKAREDKKQKLRKKKK